MGSLFTAIVLSASCRRTRGMQIFCNFLSIFSEILYNLNYAIPLIESAIAESDCGSCDKLFSD